MKSNPSAAMRVFGALFYALVCAVALVAGTAAGWVKRSEVVSAMVSQQARGVRPEEVFHELPSINILVLGCDEDLTPGGKRVVRAQARSDMMLLAKLDFHNKRITGVSIPRDLNFQLPGYRMQKINAYHAIGGPDLAKEAVQSLLGVSIDRVVVINYAAFQQLVNLVGGVEVYVEKAMKWTDKAGGLYIDLKPGRQKLDGYNAMCFVRFRHSDSDFKRQERQKEFMLAFKDSAMSSPEKLNQVGDKMVEVMNNSFTPSEVAALALFARAVGKESIKMGQVPVKDGSGYNLLLDTGKLDETLREYHLRGDDNSATVSASR